MFPGITVLKELVRLFNSRLSFAEYFFGVRFRNLQMPFIIYNIFKAFLLIERYNDPKVSVLRFLSIVY